MDNNLKDPSTIANAAREKYLKEQQRLKSDIALGEVRKANKKNESRKKLLKGFITVLAFSSLLAAYNMGKDNEIEKGTLQKEIVSYSPSAGPEIKYVDESDTDKIKPTREELEGNTNPSPQLHDEQEFPDIMPEASRSIQDIKNKHGISQNITLNPYSDDYELDSDVRPLHY